METNWIVVGFDGSPSSHNALVWAEDYARAIGASVHLVTAWHWPTSFGEPLVLSPPTWSAEADARERLEKAVAELSLPSERVRTEVVFGFAGEALVARSCGVGALVVGTRGHGSVAGALLGSVSSYCVHHAACPVVVVR